MFCGDTRHSWVLRSWLSGSRKELQKANNDVWKRRTERPSMPPGYPCKDTLALRKRNQAVFEFCRVRNLYEIVLHSCIFFCWNTKKSNQELLFRCSRTIWWRPARRSSTCLFFSSNWSRVSCHGCVRFVTAQWSPTWKLWSKPPGSLGAASSCASKYV